MSIEPARKKLKTAACHSLFSPFRALGTFTTEIPFAYALRTAKGSKPSLALITATSTTSWALWTEDSMQLKMVSEPFSPSPIAWLETDRDRIYASAGNAVFAFERGRKSACLKTDDPHDLVGRFLVLGDQVVGLDVAGTTIFVWLLDSQELYNTISLPAGFKATTLMHPATYLNKVVVGSSTGSLAIYNTHTCSLIHTFLPKDLCPAATAPASIVSIEQSPEVDILAIAYSSGHIALFDIKAGQRLMTLVLPSPLPGSKRPAPTSVSFRTDGVQHHVAVATDSGLIAVFDLDSGPDETLPQGRLVHKIEAHTSPVARIAYIPGQPLLVSNAGDNALKQWYFDASTGPRLLRSRAGHKEPVTLVRYYSPDGKALLSSSADTLRYTSVVRDSRSTDLAAKEPKGVTALAWSTIKARDWDDLVAVSDGDLVARSWSVHNRRQGKHVFELGREGLKPGQKKSSKSKVEAKAVQISACGNFCLVGGANSAEIGLWNLQSGQRRRTFTLPQKSVVTGIANDSLNKQIVVSTASGQLHFFDFHNAKLIQSLTFAASITKILLNRTNNLLAVVGVDFSVRIVDIETRRAVRELSDFGGQVLDVDFSNDGRWLLVASADCIIRTFDLPTARLVDAFRTPTITTSLAFSPTGDFLATCQVDSNAIYLWANRAQFTHVLSRTYTEATAIPDLLLPILQGEDEDQDVQELEDDATMDLSAPSRDTQLSDGLLSLSLLPRSKWQTLLNLEQIQARNKPTEAPKAPERAPFFLPTLPGVESKFLPQPLADSTNGKKQNKTSFFQSAEVESEVFKLLRDPSNAYEALFNQLINLPPSSLDLEIKSLSATWHEPFIKALAERLDTGKDFEALQSIISVFLASHRDTTVEAEGSSLQILLDAQERRAAQLNRMVGFSLGTLSFIRGLPIL